MITIERPRRFWPRLSPRAGLILLLAGAGLLLPGVLQPILAAKPKDAKPKRTSLVEVEGGAPFDDVRQDAALIGVRVTIDQVWGRWDVLYSVQPIYRLADGLVANGDIHGGDRGLELVSQAKPGYALGRILVSQGGRLDGMRCIFMRVRGGQLDPQDHYEGRWLGPRTGFKIVEIDTGGKIAVGIQGRASSELNAIGLMLAER